MLAGMQRDRDARLRAELARPHAGAVDDDVGVDAAFLAALCPGHAADAAILAVNGSDLDALDDLRAALAGALGERHGDVGRVALAVERQVHGADHAVGVEMRIHLLDLGWRDLAHVNVEGARHRRLAVELVLALLGQCHRDRADLAHAGGNTGLFLKSDVEVGRIFRQPRHVLRAAQLADQAGGMPGRARRQLLALQQHDVGPAELCQVIGDRAAGYAAADDDGAGPLGKFYHRLSVLRKERPSAGTAKVAAGRGEC